MEEYLKPSLQGFPASRRRLRADPAGRGTPAERGAADCTSSATVHSFGSTILLPASGCSRRGKSGMSRRPPIKRPRPRSSRARPTVFNWPRLSGNPRRPVSRRIANGSGLSTRENWSCDGGPRMNREPKGLQRSRRGVAGLDPPLGESSFAPTTAGGRCSGSRRRVRKSTSLLAGVGVGSGDASPIATRSAQRSCGTEPGVVDPAGILAPGDPRALARPGQFKRARTCPPTAHRGSSCRPRPERQVLDVLLAAAIGLEPDRGDRAGPCRRGAPCPRRAGRTAPARRPAPTSRPLPTVCQGRTPSVPSDQASRHQPTGWTFEPSTGLVAAVLEHDLAEGPLAVEDQPGIGAHRRRRPRGSRAGRRGCRAATGAGRCRRGRPAGRDVAVGPAGTRRRGLVDPFVEGPGEVPQRPEVLEAGRLVQQPGGRSARPALGS